MSLSSLSKGMVIVSIPPIATVLLDSQKGRRCDTCLRARVNLQRCTVCKSHWYCDKNCQMIAWKAHHRRLCKRLLVFTSSAVYDYLSPSEKLHSLLLIHLLAEHADSLRSSFRKFSAKELEEDLSDPISTLLCLLPQLSYNHVVPTISLDEPNVPDSLVAFVSSRFPNNNFTIHCARTSVFAHGVFPLASRSFNHSCAPNAIPVYQHAKGSKSIVMQVRLLRDLEPGEEITIPYVDPASPYHTRRLSLEVTYGFTCECFLCRETHSISPSVTSTQDLELWETFVNEIILPFMLPHGSLTLELRKAFFRVWNPSYLSQLTEAFGNTSHEGPYHLAVRQGATILAVYGVIYPPNFPMTGLHALELAKTCWNAYLTGHAPAKMLQLTETYLTLAESILCIVFGDLAGNQFDEEGPVSEARTLRDLLRGETNSSYYRSLS